MTQAACSCGQQATFVFTCSLTKDDSTLQVTSKRAVELKSKLFALFSHKQLFKVPFKQAMYYCRPVDDTGELDFTYDDSLLQGEEEEDTAVLATQQKEQEDQEVFAIWAAFLGPPSGT